MTATFELGGRRVGADAPPFIIAEMSGNHNQSLERALEIVDAAAGTGAHAIKLQTYTADSITLDVRHGDFVIADKDSLWAGRNLYELYQEARTPYEWHEPIMQRAKEHGMVCFSSPFDEAAVDFLETLNVPAYKIASFENIHLPLIRKVAETGKPMIISTGMASIAELDEAVRAALGAGCRNLVLLKCTSTYPATPENTNVLTIPHMRTLFGCQVGLSDHTMGVGAAVAAVAHGATVVEKHFTLRRADGGVDSAFSLEPAEMQSLVLETERAWKSMGHVTYGPTQAEKKSLAFRRSIYIAEDIAAGDVLTAENLRIVRPGFGLHPRYYEQLLGKRLPRAVARGTATSWDMFT
jgi:pseudaminic acid synthase